MAERTVYCIGETVLDLIFRDDKPVAAKPGGSMLNSAVSLGRAGIPVQFISDFGTDHAGDMIHEFLMNNGVGTGYISRYSDGKTALALAFLDENQNASYSFYKIFPVDRLTAALPVVRPCDIVLFGSFYALTSGLRDRILAFINQAKSAGAFIIYDPNFRVAHLDELESLRPMIIENISLASLVRGSDEDFRHVFSAESAEQAFRIVQDAGCGTLVYTKNNRGVEVLSREYSRSYAVPQIRTVSTIGAGDAFNAGMIHAAMTATGSELAAVPWSMPSGLPDQMIESAIMFSAEVCESLDNYISVETGNRLKA